MTLIRFTILNAYQLHILFIRIYLYVFGIAAMQNLVLSVRLIGWRDTPML